MNSEKYPVIKQKRLNNYNTHATLLENCIHRKMDLEKILFTYDNLHRLSSRISNRAQQALASSDPLVLWNYENDFVLDSKEIDDLMKQDYTEYSNQEGPSNVMHFNGDNGGAFVNTINGQPMPLMYTAPPAIMRPSMTPDQYVPAPLPIIQDPVGQFVPTPMPIAQEPAGQYVPVQMPMVQGPAPVSTNQDMSVPQSTQGMYAPAGFQTNIAPSQANNGVPLVSVPAIMDPSVMIPPANIQVMGQQMMMSPQTPMSPPNTGFMNNSNMEQVIPFSNQPTTSYNHESNAIVGDRSAEIVIDVNGFAYRRMHVSSTVLVPLFDHPSSAGSNFSYSSGQSQISNSAASNQAEYDPEESQYFEAEEFHEDDNAIIVDVDGDVTVEELHDQDLSSIETDSCLAPSAASAITPDIRPDSRESETPVSEVAKSVEAAKIVEVKSEFITDRSEETLNEVSPKKSSMDTNLSSTMDGSQNNRQPEVVESEPTTKPRHVANPWKGRYARNSHQNFEVRTTQSTPMNNQVKRTPTLDVSQWQTVSEKKASWLPTKPSSCVTVSIKKNYLKPSVIEIVEESDDNEPSTSDTKVRKPTKKEKRAQAAQKVKDEETDDFILEQAMKEKLEYLARTGSADSGISSIAEIKKKKRRTRRDIIVERVAVSTSDFKNPTDPKILSIIGQKIEERAISLRTDGRPTTHSDPMRHDFLQKVAEFEKNFIFAEDGEAVLKQYLYDRINAFKNAKNRENIVRVAIYEQIYVNCPYELLPELCFLASLISDPQFLCHEEAFFLLF